MTKNNLSDKIKNCVDGKNITVSDINIANKILNTIPDLVFITSNKGDIYFVKADSKEDLAFPAEVILGKNLADLPFPNDLLILFLSKIRESSEKRQQVVYQYKIELPNLVGYYEARVIPYEDDNVMIIIRNRSAEEEFKQSLIEREKTLSILNEDLITQRNDYIKLSKEYQSANEFLANKNEEIQNLYNQNLYNERILNQILENSPSGIFTYDLGMHINMCNLMFNEIFSAQKDELIGLNLKTLIEDADVISTLQDALKGKFGFYQGWHKSKRTLQTFYGNIKTFPLYDTVNPDKIIGGTAIVVNLTEWKHTSDQLTEREQNLYVTLNSIGDGVIVTDKEGIVTMINPVAQRLTGYSIEDALKKHIDDIFVLYNSVNDEKSASIFSEVIKKNSVITVSQQLLMISRNCEKYQVSVTASPIYYKEDTISGVVVVFQDVTENFRMFQRILLSEIRQKTLVQNSPLGVLLIHENGNILEVNKSALQMLGSPSAEATSKINVLNFEPLQKAGFSNDFINCIATKKQIEAERKYITKWGKEIYVKYYFNPIILPDTEENGILCSVVDITEQKLAEEREITYTNSLKHLSDTAISFVELTETDDPFVIIGKKLKEMSGMPFVLMRRSDNEKFYEIVQYNLPPEINDFIEKNGVILTELTVPTETVHKRSISRYFQHVKNDFEAYLYESDKRFNEIYKLLSPADIYTIDFIWESKDFGNATFFIPRDESMKNIQAVETFVNQASLLLQKRETSIRLRQSNDLYYASVNAITDNFFILDESFNLVFINNTFQKVIEKFTEGADIIGKNIFEFFPFLDESIKSAYNKIVESHKPNSGVFEFKVRDNIMYIESNSVPIIENGRIKYFITTFRDISSQTRYEKQIKELKEFNEKIIESIKDGIAVINENNEIIFTNPAFERLLKTSKGSIVGTKWTDMIADIPIDDFSAPSINEISSIVRTEVAFKTGKGDILNTMITISPADRKKNTYILLLTDITERKKMESDILKSKERAEESDRLKTAFLSNMSHEIRTPLNSIIGFSYLLKSREVPAEKQKIYLNQINSSSQMLLRLIQDIIDISKIEAGQLSIETSVFDIKVLFNELYQYFSNEISGTNKKIELKCKNRKNSLLYKNDFIRIKQVFSNLISNAIKFTDSGYIEYGYNIKNDKIQFFVQDTGIGIRKEDKKMLFQRFSRVDKRYTHETRGTGLGLVICKNIVEIMGGEIEFDSIYKKGSNFYFTLPYNKVEEKHEQKSSSTVQVNSNHNIVTVLIAEDDDINYMFIHEFLSEYKFKLIRAVNGEDVISKLNENPDISIVLMDLQMPVIDGIEATKRIRETNKDIPILAQTAYAFSSERKACIEAGCNDYISKPIVQEELLEKINKLLSTKS